MSKQVTLICDLQYGSTGKGLIAGYIAKKIKPDLVVTAWGANAGHTFVDEKGTKLVSIMVANGIIARPEYVLLGAGSMISPDKLLAEIEMYKDYLGKLPPIYIHEHATVIMDHHLEKEEQTMVKIGSTRKGVGASLAQKIARDPDNQNVAKVALKGTALEPMVISANVYEELVDSAQNVLIEGAQGFDLGINSGFYPYTTSRECNPAQICSDCSIPIQSVTRTIGVMRTFPIRVSNRYNEKGEMIGWSGPCYSDQKEIQWEDLGVEPEKTTVTKLRRRVFTWSKEQCKRAIRQCRPDEIFLNFCNYLEKDRNTLNNIIADILEAGGNLKYMGWGPTEKDIVEVTEMSYAK